MEEKIKTLIGKIKESLQKEEIIAIVYNPLKEEGINEQDFKLMHIVLQKTGYKYPLLILSGHGGWTVPGLLLPKVMLKYVNKYKVFVPGVCGSALCYLILKGNQLLVGNKTKITQMDPTFEYNGETLRAIKHLTSPDEDLKKEAREVYDTIQKQLVQLIEPPSVFEFKNLIRGEFQHMAFITDYFLNKESHDDPITIKEMLEMEMNVKNIDGDPIYDATYDLIKICQDFTIASGVRAIFVTSTPIKIDGHPEGTFICPLT